MNKKIRNLLFTFFTVIFVVMTTVILTYAFGYTLNQKGFKLEKVGVFYIKTEPKDARVLLDGKDYQNVFDKLTGKNKQTFTPAKLTNLAPKEYVVRLEKDGYWPWEKKLAIKPSETTYLENVRLFKQNSPEELFDLTGVNILNSAISPNKKVIAILTDQFIATVDLSDSSFKKFNLSRTSQNKNLAWSMDSKLLIAANSLIDLDSTSSPKTLAGKISQAVNCRFDDSSKTVVYYNDKQTLKGLSLINNQETNIYKASSQETINDFLMKDGKIYLLIQNSKTGKLSIKILKNRKETVGDNIEIPIISDFSFINTENKWLNLQDHKTNTLYLVDLSLSFNKQYSLKKLEKTNKTNWLENKKLLIANDFEINIWHREYDTYTLLTRVSQPINFIEWHKDNNYIIYSTNKSIYNLELDDRDNHQQNKLVTMANISHQALSPDGKNIYFVGDAGNKQGFYLLNLYD